MARSAKIKSQSLRGDYIYHLAKIGETGKIFSSYKEIQEKYGPSFLLNSSIFQRLERKTSVTLPPRMAYFDIRIEEALTDDEEKFCKFWQENNFESKRRYLSNILPGYVDMIQKGVTEEESIRNFFQNKPYVTLARQIGESAPEILQYLSRVTGAIEIENFLLPSLVYKNHDVEDLYEINQSIQDRLKGALEGRNCIPSVSLHRDVVGNQRRTSRLLKKVSQKTNGILYMRFFGFRSADTQTILKSVLDLIDSIHRNDQLNRVIIAGLQGPTLWLNSEKTTPVISTKNAFPDFDKYVHPGLLNKLKQEKLLCARAGTHIPIDQFCKSELCPEKGCVEKIHSNHENPDGIPLAVDFVLRNSPKIMDQSSGDLTVSRAPFFSDINAFFENFPVKLKNYPNNWKKSFEQKGVGTKKLDNWVKKKKTEKKME